MRAVAWGRDRKKSRKTASFRSAPRLEKGPEVCDLRMGRPGIDDMRDEFGHAPPPYLAPANWRRVSWWTMSTTSGSSPAGAAMRILHPLSRRII